MKPTTRDRLIPAALIVLSLVPALAGSARLAQLAGGADITPENARFFAAPVPVLLHIPAAILYSMLGAFQFAPGFRARHRTWHRHSGRVLIPLGLIVALTGLYMAHSYPWPAGDGRIVYVERLVVGVAMVVCIALGIQAIRKRSFVAHGEWMTRAYAMALGAGTQVFTHLPWFVLVDRTPGEVPRGIMMGAAWLINIMFAEWVIRRGRTTVMRFRSRGTRPARSATARSVNGVVPQ